MRPDTEAHLALYRLKDAENYLKHVKTDIT